jgi:hypothetical protein
MMEKDQMRRILMEARHPNPSVRELTDLILDQGMFGTNGNSLEHNWKRFIELCSSKDTDLEAKGGTLPGEFLDTAVFSIKKARFCWVYCSGISENTLDPQKMGSEWFDKLSNAFSEGQGRLKLLERALNITETTDNKVIQHTGRMVSCLTELYASLATCLTKIRD